MAFSLPTFELSIQKRQRNLKPSQEINAPYQAEHPFALIFGGDVWRSRRYFSRVSISEDRASMRLRAVASPGVASSTRYRIAAIGKGVLRPINAIIK